MDFYEDMFMLYSFRRLNLHNTVIVLNLEFRTMSKPANADYC